METEERKKILIVDDDPMALKVIRSYLKDSYKVYCIRSGEEALKFLSMQIPDVVLLDYMMPGMDVRRCSAGYRRTNGHRESLYFL
jgi:CheY-like chemotaxis protein